MRSSFDSPGLQLILFSPYRQAHRWPSSICHWGVSPPLRAADTDTRRPWVVRAGFVLDYPLWSPGRHAEPLPWPGASPEGRARGGNQGVCWFPPRSARRDGAHTYAVVLRGVASPRPEREKDRRASFLLSRTHLRALTPAHGAAAAADGQPRAMAAPVNGTMGPRCPRCRVSGSGRGR